MDIISTKDLCYSYDEKMALDHVNFNIPQDSVTAVLGGNGAGKSTLFLNLNGVLKPDSGKVYYNGEEMKYTSKNVRLLSSKIGIVFQDPNDQIFSDTVRNDIAFGAINMGMEKAKAKQAVDEIARRIGICDLLDKPVHALSFGQKKRVAIAGVLIMKPDVIILDEPTAGLDPAGIKEIFDLITEIKKETHISVILSTHEIDIVPLFCEYCYILDQGRVVFRGTVNELLKDPAILRKSSLRTPRVMHLMEILKKEDHFDVDVTASTISKARKSIKELLSNE